MRGLTPLLSRYRKWSTLFLANCSALLRLEANFSHLSANICCSRSLWVRLCVWLCGCLPENLCIPFADCDIYGHKWPRSTHDPYDTQRPSPITIDTVTITVHMCFCQTSEADGCDAENEQSFATVFAYNSPFVALTTCIRN